MLSAIPLEKTRGSISGFSSTSNLELEMHQLGDISVDDFVLTNDAEWFATNSQVEMAAATGPTCGTVGEVHGGTSSKSPTMDTTGGAEGGESVGAAGGAGGADAPSTDDAPPQPKPTPSTDQAMMSLADGGEIAFDSEAHTSRSTSVGRASSERTQAVSERSEPSASEGRGSEGGSGGSSNASGVGRHTTSSSDASSEGTRELNNGKDSASSGVSRSSSPQNNRPSCSDRQAATDDVVMRTSDGEGNTSPSGANSLKRVRSATAGADAATDAQKESPISKSPRVARRALRNSSRD